MLGGSVERAGFGEFFDLRLALVRSRIVHIAVFVARADRDVQGAADFFDEERVLEHPIEPRVHPQRDLAETVRTVVGLDDGGQVFLPLVRRVLDDPSAVETKVDTANVVAAVVHRQVDEDLTLGTVGVRTGEDLAVGKVTETVGHHRVAVRDFHLEGELSSVLRMLGDDSDLLALVDHRRQQLLGLEQWPRIGG